MALAGRTFRIFVSSTFSDMKKERSALQERVFPKLRELCLRHGCRFQAIDLRWGVSAEAALDQQTMKICLKEIERCRKTSPRPNFIVLLGNRYGWRPLPPEIPAEEFEEIEKRVDNRESAALLRAWYKRDENQVPPAYVLQPRQVKIHEGASESEKDTVREAEACEWGQTESRLRRIFLRAVRDITLSGDKVSKYTASATEQEVEAGVMNISDASEHVFCFFREIAGQPNDPSLAEDFLDLDAQGNIDRDSTEKLEILKSSLRSRLPANVFDYKAGWTEKGISNSHIDRLCEDVQASLSRVILSEIEKLEDHDALEKETADHVAFGLDRSRFFIGRTKILQAIREYLARQGRMPLVIYGKPGSGKSALMAKCFEQAHEANPHAGCFVRYIGATPGSLDIRNLLESLCRQISRAYGAREEDIPLDFRELVNEFPKRLALATADKPLILFLDALDQLSEAHTARGLAWLPARLPDHVRIVVSLLSGDSLEALRNKISGDHLMELEAMPSQEGESLLDLWLKDAGRALQQAQRDEVLGKFQKNGLPLYLRIAFEEASHWRSYAGDSKLSPDISGLVRTFFARLSQETHHGGMLVARSLGYLAAAKNGLSEDELLDLLSTDRDVIQDFLRRSPRSPQVGRLPVVIWSRLYFDIEPYLIERSADGTSLMTFYHPTSVGAEAKRAFLSDAIKPVRHRHLAEYFGKQDLTSEKSGLITANLRKLSEWPYQLTFGEEWHGLLSSLSDPIFWERKCQAEPLGIDDLIQDFSRALEYSAGLTANRACPASMKETFAALSEVLGAEASSLRKYPELAAQQAWNRLYWRKDVPGDIRGRFESLFERHRPDGRMMLFGAVPSYGRLAEGTQTLTFEERPVALAMMPDGILAIDRHGRWQSIDAKGIIRCEGKIDTESLRSVRFGARQCAVLAGSLIAFWSRWPDEGPLLFRTGWPIEDIDISPDGRLLVIGETGDWIVYDTTEKRPSRLYQGKVEAHATRGAIARDGKNWLIGADGRVWLFVDQQPRVLESGVKAIRTIEFSHDGRQLFILDGEGDLRVLDSEGKILFQVRGASLTDAAYEQSADGIMAVSSSGACLHLHMDKNQWLKDIVHQTSGYLRWVRCFPHDQRFAVLSDEGFIQIVDYGESLSGRAPEEQIQPLGPVVGAVPFKDRSAILGCLNGDVFKFSYAGDPKLEMIQRTRSALKALYSLHSDSVLLVHNARSHSYLEELSDLSGSGSTMNLGPKETLDAYRVWLYFSKMSPRRKYLLLGSWTAENPPKTKIELYETKSMRRKKERWETGHWAQAIPDDEGDIALCNGERNDGLRIFGQNDELLGECHLNDAEPVAFDSRGQTLLLLDSDWCAWLYAAPWDNQKKRRVQERARSGVLSADGRLIVVFDREGLINIYGVDDADEMAIKHRARFPLGWLPEGCDIYPDRSECFVYGGGGFQILRWA